MSTVTTSAPKTQRKPRTKPARSINIVEPATPDTDGFFAAVIKEGKKQDTYVIGPVEHDLPNLLAFEVEKVSMDAADDGLLAPYTVVIDTAGPAHSCECMGHLKHGHKTQCRHVAGLLALHAAGQLVTAHDVRRNPELTYVDEDGYSEEAERESGQCFPDDAA